MMLSKIVTMMSPHHISELKFTMAMTAQCKLSASRFLAFFMACNLGCTVRACCLSGGQLQLHTFFPKDNELQHLNSGTTLKVI